MFRAASIFSKINETCFERTLGMHEILSQIRELETLVFFNYFDDPFKEFFMKSFESQKSYDLMTFSIILYDYILSKNELIWAEFL